MQSATAAEVKEEKPEPVKDTVDMSTVQSAMAEINSLLMEFGADDLDMYESHAEVEAVAQSPGLSDDEVSVPEEKPKPKPKKQEATKNAPKKKKAVVLSDDEEDQMEDIENAGAEDVEEAINRHRQDDRYESAASEDQESLVDVSEEDESCVDSDSEEPQERKRLTKYKETHIISDDEEEEGSAPDAEVKITKIKTVIKPKPKKKKVKNPFIDDAAEEGSSEESVDCDDDLLGDEDKIRGPKKSKDKKKKKKRAKGSDDEEESDDGEIPEHLLVNGYYKGDGFVVDDDVIEEEEDGSESQSEPRGYFSHARLNNNPDLFERKQKKLSKKEETRMRVEKRKEKMMERKKSSKLGKAIDSYKEKRNGSSSLNGSDEDKYTDVSDWLDRAPGSEIARVREHFKKFFDVKVDQLIEMSYGRKFAQRLKASNFTIINDMLYSIIPESKRQNWNPNAEFYSSLVKSYVWTQFLIVAQYFDKSNLYKLYANPNQRMEFAEKMDRRALLNCFPWCEWYDIFCAKWGIYEMKMYTTPSMTPKDKQKGISAGSSNNNNNATASPRSNESKFDYAYLQSLSTKEKATRRDRSVFDGADIDAMETDKEKLEYLCTLLFSVWEFDSYTLDYNQLNSLPDIYVCPFSGKTINKTEQDKKEGAIVYVLFFTNRREFVFMTKPTFNLYNSPFMRVATILIQKLSLKNAYTGESRTVKVEKIKEEPRESQTQGTKRIASMMSSMVERAVKKQKMTKVYIKEEGMEMMIDANSALFEDIVQALKKNFKSISQRASGLKKHWNALPDFVAVHTSDEALNGAVEQLVVLLESDLNAPSVILKVFEAFLKESIPEEFAKEAVIERVYKGASFNEVSGKKMVTVYFAIEKMQQALREDPDYKEAKFSYKDAEDLYAKYPSIFPLLYFIFNFKC